MVQQRPDPHSLPGAGALPASSGQGKLKIFLGMAPGVGKTYTMLLGGLDRAAEGITVVIGAVETHGRPELEALLTRTWYTTALLASLSISGISADSK